MQQFRHLQVRANGIKFNLLEKGEGPLFLCLHGFPDHPRSFRYQLNYFAAQGFRVVAPFMRGYSPTETALDQSFQSANLAQDVIGLIDVLGHETAIVYGHDWGSAAAYGAAVLAPEKISQLIVAAVPYGHGFAQALLEDADQQRLSWYMFFFQTPLAEVAISLNHYQFIEKLWQDWSPGWRYDKRELALIKETLAKPNVLKAALQYYRTAFNPDLHSPQLKSLQTKMNQLLSSLQKDL